MRAGGYDLETCTAAERAIPPLSERPPPCFRVPPDDKRYAEPGVLTAPVVRAFRGEGYGVRIGPDEPAGVPPISVYVQTRPAATASAGRRVAAVWGCRTLTPEERNLVTAYSWLPERTMARLTKRIPHHFRDDYVVNVGHPYLCYAAMRYDPTRRIRFGTFAGRDLYSRFLTRMARGAVHRAAVDAGRVPAVTSLCGAVARGAPEPEARPDGPDTSEAALAALFDAHLPASTQIVRRALIRYLGLDGDDRARLWEAAHLLGVKSRLHAQQILDRELRRGLVRARTSGG